MQIHKQNKNSSTSYISFRKEYLVTPKTKKNLIDNDKKRQLNNTSFLFFKRKTPGIIGELNGNEKQSMIRSTSFYLSRTELMHHKPIFYIPKLIPESITDRLKLFYSIFTEEEFLKQYNNTPSIITTSLDDIIKYLRNYKGKRGVFDTYAMFFYYICHKMSYDYNDDQYNVLSKTGSSYKNNKLKAELIENRLDPQPQDIANDAGSVDEEIDIEEEKLKRTPEEILESGKAIQEEYCRLFEYFCKISHLKVKRIKGHCKYFPKLKKSNDAFYNHCWNVIEIRNKWYLIDLTLGSGSYNPNNKNIGNSFNPYFFLTPSEYLMNSHFPKETNWQLLPKTLIYQHYQKKMNFLFGDFYRQVYHHQIELQSHSHPYIKLNTLETSIVLKVKDSILRANLFSLKNNTKLSEIKYSYNEVKNIFTFIPVFPGNGNYIVKIVGRSITSTDLIYLPYLEYKIHLNIDSEIKTISNLLKQKAESFMLDKIQKRSHNTGKASQPKIISDYNASNGNKKMKKICMDNGSAYLFEPKATVLKKGTETKFKVKIKNALAVALLDGRKWNYMKRREEDIWEGMFILQADNVSICSLKACNVYTEVFEFKTIKV